MHEKRVRHLIRLKIFAVQALGQNTNTLKTTLGLLSIRRRYLLVYTRKNTVQRRDKHGPCRKHDRGIMRKESVVKLTKRANQQVHEGMTRDGEHEIVAHSDRDGLGKDEIKAQKRIKAFLASNI